MNIKLYLEFLDENDQPTRIILNDPKEDLNTGEIISSMEQIISSDALHNKGFDLTTVDKAYTIEQVKTEYLTGE